MTISQESLNKFSMEMKSEIHYKKAAEKYKKSKQYINMILTEKLKQRGVWIRVPAYILPVAPPLTSNKDQIDQICDAIDGSLSELEKEIN